MGNTRQIVVDEKIHRQLKTICATKGITLREYTENVLSESLLKDAKAKAQLLPPETPEVKPPPVSERPKPVSVIEENDDW